MRDPASIIIHKKSGLTLADAAGFTILAGMIIWLIFFRD